MIYASLNFALTLGFPKVRFFRASTKMGSKLVQQENQYFIETLTNLNEFFKFRKFR